MIIMTNKIHKQRRHSGGRIGRQIQLPDNKVLTLPKNAIWGKLLQKKKGVYDWAIISKIRGTTKWLQGVFKGIQSIRILGLTFELTLRLAL